MSRARAFGPAARACLLLMMASLGLQAVLFALIEVPQAIRYAGLVPSASGLGLGAAAVHRRRGVYAAAGIAAWAGAVYAFVVYLNQSTTPFELRLLHLAVLFAHASVVMGAIVIGPGLVDTSRALLLLSSTVLSLMVGEAVTGPALRNLDADAWWTGGLSPHPVLGHYNPPYSTAKIHYPSNPRGYFHVGAPFERDWRFTTERGSMARAEFPQDEPGVVRAVVIKAESTDPWAVTLNQIFYPLRGGRRYRVRFRARADGDRTLTYSFVQGHYPYVNLGLQKTLSLGPAWQTLSAEFVATGSAKDAMLHFDVAGSPATVSIGDPEVWDAATERRLVPTPSSENSVAYRFNALGCRGPDYTTPRPAGTFRILTLGDSYTLGYGVHEEDTFQHALERMLNERAKAEGSNVRFEVLSCGTNGYVTYQERMWYELYLHRYAPQLVLLNMVNNDDEPFSEGHPRLPRAGRSEYLSALWHLVQRARYLMPWPDYNPSMDEVLRLARFCRMRESQLAVVIFRNHHDVDDWTELVRVAGARLGQTDVPVLDLGPALLRGAPKELWVHPEDSHPNEVAHAIAAREVLGFLDRSALLPSAGLNEQ